MRKMKINNILAPRIIVLTSDKPRHTYFIERLIESVNVVGVIREEKFNHFSDAKNMSEEQKKHSFNLSEYESRLMPSIGYQIPNLIEIKQGEINNKKLITWAKECKPTAIALFGTSILDSDWVRSYPEKIINLHLGSSPRYRGSATMFWPFYNDEIDHVASTIHIASEKVDAGAILGKVSLNPNQLENYYQYSTETIRRSIEQYPATLISYLAGDTAPLKQEVNQQKYLYRRADFSETALRRVIQKYGI